MRNFIAFLAAQLVIAFALWSMPACNRIPDPKHVAEIVYDCTVETIKAKADELAELLRPLMQRKMPEMSKAFAIAKDAGKEIGGCALARVAQEVMSNRGAPPDAEAGFAIMTTLDKFRLEVAGSADAAFEVELDGQRVRL